MAPAPVSKRALAFSPDGSLLAGGQADGVTVWTTRDDKVFYRLRWGPDCTVGWLPTAKPELCGGGDDGPRLWSPGETGNGRLFITDWKNEWGVLGATAGSPTLTAVAYRGRNLDGGVACYERKQGAEVRRFGDGNGQSVHQLAFSPNGKRLAVARPEAVEVVDTETWKSDVIKVKAPRFGFSPNGATLAVGSGEEVGLYDAATGERKAVLVLPGRAVVGVGYTPNGRWLVVACADGGVELWNATRRAVAHVLAKPGKPVVCLAVSPAPNRPLVAVGDEAGTHRKWNTASY